MVVFDARSATTGRTTGWERYAARLAREFEGDPEIRVWSVRADGLLRRLGSDLAARRLTRGGLVHYPTFPPIACRSRDAFVVTLYDLTWWRYPELSSRLGLHYYRPAMERAIALATAVTTISDTVADEIVEHFGLDRAAVHVSYLGADFAEGSVEEAPAPDRPYVLFVGTIEPRKNLARLVAAWGKTCAAEDFDLVLVGRLGWGSTPKGVHVLTDVTDSRLRTLYRGAHALVAPSLYEGFGLPLVEALAMGTPVLCSDIPVFREVAGDSAHYFDPLDVESIAAALDQVASLDRVSAEIQQSVRDKYAWSTVADRLRELYREATP